jgi:eukaryotic-like serine/threonine-protein kinase
MSRDPLSATTATRIGRYDVICELGRGGMGIVYRAEDKLIGREIAIKTLTETTPELRERFYVEARSGILNHANIVTIYELGEYEGNPYIAMEYVAGESLEKILGTGNKPSLLETLSTIEQLCSGVGYAHQNGVLHRDVKPANLIVQPDGRVKIVDFGIARLADQTTRLTRTDALIGTFHYIAPERLKGEMSDGRSDIWSAGVILYQMITGQVPFDGANVSTLYKVISEPYPPLRNYNADLPEELIAVVERALAKNPDDRYSTAEEMAFDLQAISGSLQKERMGDLMISAKRLMEQGQLAHARTVLLDLQRIDSQDIDVRRMMREVQEQLSRTQKTEQVRQLVEQAEEAVHYQRYDEAIQFYRQAIRLDQEDTFQLNERLDNILGLKERLDRIGLLRKQAVSARERGDLIAAQDLLGQAITLDEKSTDLRNAYAIVLREIGKKNNEGKLQELLQVAREDYISRRYTDTIARLREATELDPTHPEVQQLLHDAVNRQDQEIRRKLNEQIAAEVQDCLYHEDFDRALKQLNRALEKLPTEASLLRLKVETEKKKREFQAQQVAQAATQKAQDLFTDAPEESIAVVEAALEQVPGDERLVQLKFRLEEHIRRLKRDELLAQSMRQAHNEIDAAQFDQAIQILESARIECGTTEDVTALLEFARAEKHAMARHQQSSETRAEAQALMTAGKYEAAIAKLEPVAAVVDDPALNALLEQARQTLQETLQRLKALESRSRLLAETDLQVALRLLESQSPEVIADSKISALRQELSEKADVQRAIQAAIAHFEASLAKQDLRGSMDALESVRRAHGESPALTQAITESRGKRLSVANASLTASMEEASKALQRNEPQEAREALRGSEKLAEYADTQLRSNWKHQLKTVSKAPNTRSRAGEKSLPATVKGKSWAWAYVAAGLIVAAIFGLVWTQHTNSPMPVLLSTYLQLNASPWAIVQQVTDGNGLSLELPAGDHSTPLRLNGLPIGNYQVTFQGADKTIQVERCQLTLAKHLCTSSFAELNVKQLLSGDQP